MTGDEVVLDGAFLWDRVHIADNVDISHSVICDEAEVKEKVKLKPHCVLSSQVSCIYVCSAFCLSWQVTRLRLDHARIQGYSEPFCRGRGYAAAPTFFFLLFG